jgi:hypothetical protein
MWLYYDLQDCISDLGFYSFRMPEPAADGGKAYKHARDSRWLCLDNVRGVYFHYKVDKTAIVSRAQLSTLYILLTRKDRIMY